MLACEGRALAIVLSDHSRDVCLESLFGGVEAPRIAARHYAQRKVFENFRFASSFVTHCNEAGEASVALAEPISVGVRGDIAPTASCCYPSDAP